MALQFHLFFRFYRDVCHCVCTSDFLYLCLYVRRSLMCLLYIYRLRSKCVVRLLHPLSVLTLLLSGTRSSLMRRLVPQSLASSSSAISCRWNTATWADRRLTLPLGVLSKSSPWLWICAAFSWSRPPCFSFSLTFSLGWLDGAFSCQSFLSDWICSFFLPPGGNSSETTLRYRKRKMRWKSGSYIINLLSTAYLFIVTTIASEDNLTLSLPVLLLVSVTLSLVVVAVMMVAMVGGCSVRTW